MALAPLAALLLAAPASPSSCASPPASSASPPTASPPEPMPTLARACRHPGCRDTARRGKVTCESHARPAHEPTATPRPSASARGYDAAWRRTRRLFLLRHPLCAGTHRGAPCDQPATEADHVVPIADGGPRLNWSNLQPLCKPCHSRKTAAENRGAGGRIARRQHA